MSDTRPTNGPGGNLDRPESIRALAGTTEKPWLVRTDEPLELLARVFWPYDHRNLQLSVRWLDGAKMRTTEGALDEFATALQFPYWFGRNWDALLDLLRAPNWELKRSYVLIVRNAHELLEDEPPQQLKTFFDILHGASRDLAGGTQLSYDELQAPTPFHAVFHVEPEKLFMWAGKLMALEVSVPRMPVRNIVSWDP